MLLAEKIPKENQETKQKTTKNLQKNIWISEPLTKINLFFLVEYTQYLTHLRANL